MRRIIGTDSLGKSICISEDDPSFASMLSMIEATTELSQEMISSTSAEVVTDEGGIELPQRVKSGGSKVKLSTVVAPSSMPAPPSVP